ncbi:hypothetical protein [Dictyobacter kobayashii]|uniref:Uncharacterized protein n=1 Tax=Dictyobacter kobayashii TaxID=2014872 RepID=A0A402AYA2_9CHLR|nr:hypothetical protein [Dictyobacter kobayashii]GCE24068.1 hypothetical protein KDK_78680 [Dictyobacter kobayashii]
MLTTKSTHNNSHSYELEKKQDKQQQIILNKQLLRDLLPLDDEKATQILTLVAAENHKILRLSLLESF